MTPSATTTNVLGKLDKVRRSGQGWLARCPAHADGEPSLSIGEENGRTLLRCMAGCETESILTAVNMRWGDLFDGTAPANGNGQAPGRRHEEPMLPVEERKAMAAYVVSCNRRLRDGSPLSAAALEYVSDRFGLDAETAIGLGLGVDGGSSTITRPKFVRSFAPHPRLVIPFKDRKGEVRGVQGRVLDDDHEPRWAGPSGRGWARYAFLGPWDSATFGVVCEGPSDGLALAAAGFPAVAIRGASLKPDNDLIESLSNLRGVVVVGDNDEAGEKFASDAVREFEQAGMNTVRVAVPDEHSDLASWSKGVGRDQFAQEFAEAIVSTRAEPTSAQVEEPGAAEDVAPTPITVASHGWDDPHPLDSATAQPFPVDALPAVLRDFVSAEAVSTQTPEDLSGLLSLSVVAACTSGRVWLDVRPDWSEPTNLWTATALESGENKSRVVRDVTAPLIELEAELAEEARPRISEQRTLKEMAEQRAAASKKAAANATGVDRQAKEAEAIADVQYAESIEVPVEPRLIAGDVTPEKLVGLLSEQNGRIAVFSAEGGLFAAMAGRYEQKRGGTSAGLDVFLQSHAGEAIRVDRVGRPGDHVRAACLSVGLAIQPDVLRGLHNIPGFKGRGLLGRFCYALPVSRMGWRDMDPTPVPAPVRDSYQEAVKTIGRALFDLPEPVRLAFEPDAVEALNEFRSTIEPRLRPAGDLRHMSEWAAKAHGAVARIAGLLHVADRLPDGGDWKAPVNAETVRRAVTIGNYLLSHALLAHDHMGSDEKLEAARFTLEWLRKRTAKAVANGEPVPSHLHRRELMKGTNRSRFPDSPFTAEVLALLAEMGWLREIEAEPTGGRQIAGPLYEVHPTLLASEEHAERGAA